MNPEDVPADLVDHAAAAIREFDPQISAAKAHIMAAHALGAVVWRVELRAGVGTHVCTIHGRDQ